MVRHQKKLHPEESQGWEIERRVRHQKMARSRRSHCWRLQQISTHQDVLHPEQVSRPEKVLRPEVPTWRGRKRVFQRDAFKSVEGVVVGNVVVRISRRCGQVWWMVS